MRRLVLVGGVAGLLMLLVAVAWASIALNSSRSNIYRVQGAVVLSATASLTGPNQTQTVFTTPDDGDFVLTQLCVGPVAGGIRLAATGFGPIAHTGGTPCYTFVPGVSVPKTSTMTCATTAAAARGDYFCTISGLLAN